MTKQHRNKGRKFTPEHRTKISEGTRKALASPEVRAKISEAIKKQWQDPEYRAKISEAKRGENHPFFGKKHTEETKAKMSKAHKGKKLTPETRAKMSKVTKKRWEDPKERVKISAGLQGVTLEQWSGFATEQPYCHLFNKPLKEHIRNRTNRVCAVCGKSALQNKTRLSVHHLDENKMQGCDDWEWRLAVLCRNCHRKTHNGHGLLLRLLLLNNKKHQTNLSVIRKQTTRPTRPLKTTIPTH
jgi:NADH:ubiquinone oxidoreductase subunit E